MHRLTVGADAIGVFLRVISPSCCRGTLPDQMGRVLPSPRRCSRRRIIGALKLSFFGGAQPFSVERVGNGLVGCSLLSQPSNVGKQAVEVLQLLEASDRSDERMPRHGSARLMTHKLGALGLPNDADLHAFDQARWPADPARSLTLLALTPGYLRSIDAERFAQHL